MQIKTALTVIVAAACIGSGAAMAQSTTPVPKPTTAATTSASSSSAAPSPTTPVTDRKARSAECSAIADKQGLHGRARKEFRFKCIYQK